MPPESTGAGGPADFVEVRQALQDWRPTGRIFRQTAESVSMNRIRCASLGLLALEVRIT